MKTPQHQASRFLGGASAVLAGLFLTFAPAEPGWAQYEVPQLMPGAPNPFTPTNAANAPWNRTSAYTPGGGLVIVANRYDTGSGGFSGIKTNGYTVQNQIGTAIVPLTSQYGVGDFLFPPEQVAGEGWVATVTAQGNPWAVQWLTYANTNLLVAVDEGLAVVNWSNTITHAFIPQTYTIGPNLSRRPVRLFWTEGQYAGPRVRFGSSYEVNIYYNTQIENPTNHPGNITNIANEKIEAVSPTVFLKNGELRATAGAKGRICIAYSRRPEGVTTNRELLGFEVVDVLEPMSATIAAHVADRLLPRRTDNPKNELFCDITRGGVDATGSRPDQVFAYKHMTGQRNGWVWAIRPTEAPWQIEIFWKAKEQLDVIWPFEVDNYDVTWDLNSQLCALVHPTSRGGAPVQVHIPQEIIAHVMPYQAYESVTSGTTNYPKGSGIAFVSNRALQPVAPGMCTLKYTIGEDVWFETIRIVSELCPLVYQGERSWSIGKELGPFTTTGSPEQGRYNGWPALLRIPDPALIDSVDGDARWDRYHPGLYNYPVGYPSDPTSIHSQVFAVNVGKLALWWWNQSALVADEQFPYPIYWPSIVCDYHNEWPASAPQIVIASFQGSSYGSWYDDGSASLLFSGVKPVLIQGTPQVIGSDGPLDWGNPPYTNSFTFETWIKPVVVTNYCGVMNLSSVNGSNQFSLFVKDGQLAAAVLARSPAGTVSTNEWYATRSVSPQEWTHVAFTYTNGVLEFYVKGEPSGKFIDFPADLNGYMANSVRLGAIRSWLTNGTGVSFGFFRGWMDQTRMWDRVRTQDEMLTEYASALDMDSNPALKVQFDFAGQQYEVSQGVYAPADISGLFYLADTANGQVAVDNAQGSNVQLRRRGRAYAKQGPVIYVQNDANAPGYNPNEEHALMAGAAAYALRCDLNITNPSLPDATSMPFTLVEYTPNLALWPRAIDVYQVVATNKDYPEFIQHIEAGRMIQPPAPLRSVLPDNCAKTKPIQSDAGYVLRDRLKYWWAKQAADNGDHLDVVFRFFYPMQYGFWIPQLPANAQPEPLTEIPWLSAWGHQNPSSTIVLGGTPVDVTFDIKWPEPVPRLPITGTLTKPEYQLPAIRGQKSVSIVYQQSLALHPNETPSKNSVVLIDPTRARKVALEQLPPKMRAMRDPKSGNTFFSDLDPDLRERLFYVPGEAPTNRLYLKGIFVEEINYWYLRLNLMTDDLVGMAKDPKRVVGMNLDWTNAINALPTERVEVPDENTPVDSYALSTPGFGAGYVTVLFNNSTNIDMVDPGDPVDMAVILVEAKLNPGRIAIIQSANPLDKYLTLRHTSDFAGVPKNWSFEWQYGSPVGGLAPTNSSDWHPVPVDDPDGAYSTIFGSSGEFGLGDAYVKCRFRALDPLVKTIVGTNWSEFTEPVPCEGWIKRVLKAINPFDQRIRDFNNYALNMQLSMLQQAGQPYAGDIPMNMEALNDYGLIPIYQTVLEQARGLSIDSTLDPMGTDINICLALMLVAGRLNDCYMVLGNEAYADAMNSSISLGIQDPVFSADASSIFAFQGIVPTLLDEELALLRGRDCVGGINPKPTEFPLYNRLPWNFTADIAHGQPAYVLNYGISDLKGNQDGFVDTKDAAKLFPQGHGDAWGHYLSALKSYYYLWRHRNFTWAPQTEAMYVATINVTMSALHELKFAASAAAKARAGVAIMERTYSKLYEEGTPEPWRAQRDTMAERVWGVGEWGARVHMGAYFDWLMANALLPSPESNDYANPTNTNPLMVIDRTTVPELTQILLQAEEAQRLVDMADRGMNPLGLAAGSVPFDISPAEIDQGKTHFEQAYAKAQEALKVARGVFERIQISTAALRDQNEERDLDTVVLQQEQAYERQLLDLYGYPYKEDIGPGKLYPEGYNGPDTQHFAYINRYDYFGRMRTDTELIQSLLIVPNVVGSGIRSYDPGELVSRPPPSDPALTIEDILFFIDPSYAAEWERLKAKYSEALGKVNSTRGDIESLGIPELTSFYDTIMGAYGDAESALMGALNDAVGWFDGVISAPVDAIDDFISKWVGVNTPLEPLTIVGPNITYTTNLLNFWVGTDGLPAKPANYVSARRAEGEIQIVLSQYVLALREATAAIAESQDLYQKMVSADQAYRSTVGAQIGSYYEGLNSLEEMNSLEQIMAVVDKAIALVNKVYDTSKTVAKSVEDAIPAIAGVAFDIKAAVMSVVGVVNAAVDAGTLIDKLAHQEQVVSTEADLETQKRILELNTQAGTIWDASNEAAKKVVDAALAYLSSLQKIDVVLQKSETCRMQYERAKAAADQILNEREQARRIWATDLTDRRYRNMAYQIIRNDDLVRFDQAFAMARRYVYLAAKAYDYETGLLRQDGAVGQPGREFLSQIVRSRALGRFLDDGTPLPGGSTGDPGLADIMARMNANWFVLEGRLNFNNPQTEAGIFSLRQELFRIPPGDAFDKTWREVLAKYKVADVRDLLEYRTYCLPFSPAGAAEPALVIPFSTTINFRENFFGLPLTAGDNAYDSTHFATKARGIGVWFANYRNTMLANQPRVYLVPVGSDRMRVPDGVGETVRSWDILDQALPIPYPLSNESWMRPDWNIRADVLGGEFFVRRRYASLRAYHDSGFNMAEMTLNSRLIGRSVWNTKWLLIIPGGTLLADAEKGLEQFIRGRELAYGSGTYDGQGVKDVKLYFLTYSYSGN
jgi:hypothetical protein